MVIFDTNILIELYRGNLAVKEEPSVLSPMFSISAASPLPNFWLVQKTKPT